MDERKVAARILEQARRQVSDPDRIRSVRVTVDPRAGVSPGSLVKDFYSLAREWGIQTATLEIGNIMAECECPICECRFPAQSIDPKCPRCGRKGAEFENDSGIAIEAIEVLEPKFRY